MNEAEGQKLLHAVERIIEDPDGIIALVERLKSRSSFTDVDLVREEVGRQVVTVYSNRSALSGGATALPALVPGMGTLATLAGSSLLDMGLMLKFEVEMVLALSHLYGFDIRDEKERQVAFLLASVSTYDARSGRNFFLDLAEAQSTAIWNYAPRELGKLLATAFTRLALMTAGRSLAKAVPIVGVVIGTGANKILTHKVGVRCQRELERRRRLADEEVARGEDVVDAKVVSQPPEGSP